MTLDEMRAHRDALADELRFWEMAQRGFAKGPAMVAALRWAVTLADERIFDTVLDEIDANDPAFQAKIRAALNEPPTRTLTPLGAEPLPAAEPDAPPTEGTD